jgi:hypothetical protein
MSPSAVYLKDSNRVTVAVMCGRHPVMDEHAGMVLAAVKGVAAQHVETGDYMRKLGIKNVPGELGTGRLVRDRLVVADDPAAAAIEFGHLIRYKNSRRVRWEPGQHVMARGLSMVKTVG